MADVELEVTEEDDGVRLDVFLVRGVVDRVSAIHPAACTAVGICPGITKEQLGERLAKVMSGRAASQPSSLYLCEEDHFLSDYYLVIDYTPKGEVAKLELVLDRP